MVYWGDVHSWGSMSPVSKPLQWHTLPVILNSFFFFFYKTLFTIHTRWPGSHGQSHCWPRVALAGRAQG